MTADNKKDYIHYRLTKADEALNDAKNLFHTGSGNATINRLYYACFYAVTALLLSNDIETKTHAGTKTQFGLNFIKTGIIPIKFGQLYSDIMDSRQMGDYGDMIDFAHEDVLPFIEPVEEFIGVIKQLIRT
jgi:uncharacterized protein